MENPLFSDAGDQVNTPIAPIAPTVPTAPNTMTTSEVVALTGVRRADIARWLRTRSIDMIGIDRVTRENIYPKQEILAAIKNSKGKGNRKRGPERTEASLKSWETRRANQARKEQEDA